LVDVIKNCFTLTGFNRTFFCEAFNIVPTP